MNTHKISQKDIELVQAIESEAIRGFGLTPQSIQAVRVNASGYTGPYSVSSPISDLSRNSIDVYICPEWITAPGPIAVLQIARGFLDRCGTYAYGCAVGKDSQGLIYPRDRNLPFPIPLYTPPSDTSPLGECYAMYLAMSHAVYQQRNSVVGAWPPNKALYIDNIIKAPTVDSSGKTVWNLGEGEINYYNGNGNLKIQLNQDTYQRGPFTQDDWSGAMDHEILHNLGWTHDDNYNPKCYMIVHEGCVSGHPRGLSRYLESHIIADR